MTTTKRIADIVTLFPGYQARKAIEPSEGGSHFLIQIRDFNKERTAIDAGSMIRFWPANARADQVLQDGDVLFLAKGAKSFGFTPQDLPGPTLAAGYFFALRPRVELHSAYLAWFLNHASTRRHIAKYMATTAHMPVVRRGDLENLEVPLPPLDVQRSIVELDKLKQQEQALYQELANKKKNLLDAACMRAAAGTENRRDHE